ncbi:MAG: TetR/AcrR family transcriptional regulator, partial [Polyangia bacterium]
MDVRTKILEEATRLFAAQGVDGTAIQEIADAVGVAKPSLLYHFPSKEALHRSVLEHLLSRWNEIVPRLLRAVAREDRFDAILDATIEFFAADPDRARL